MIIRLSPAVRIIPPSEVIGNRWVAESILDKRRYNISRTSAAALVAASRPQEPQDLVRQLAETGAHEGSAADWERVVETLFEHELIIDAARIDSDPRLRWLVNLRQNWSRFGWCEAAEYHALSFDYPCVDYSEATGTVIDQSRMRAYQSREPDIDRHKLDYLDNPGTPLPEPSEDMPSETAQALWRGSPGPAPADVEALSDVLSLAFGSTGVRVPVTDSAPLLRRSSPSGGGRHPSEGYVVARDVPGLEPGWYHVTMKPFSLRTIGDRPVDDDALRRTFPLTFRSFAADVKALVIVTTVFERNMYRYREPRTFRTVHMDAGHIASTVRMSARSLGLTAEIYDGDPAGVVEEALGLNGMQEGYLLTVALGDGTSAPNQDSQPAIARQERSAS